MQEPPPNTVTLKVRSPSLHACGGHLKQPFKVSLLVLHACFKGSPQSSALLTVAVFDHQVASEKRKDQAMQLKYCCCNGQSLFRIGWGKHRKALAALTWSESSLKINVWARLSHKVPPGRAQRSQKKHNRAHFYKTLGTS